MHMNEVVMDEWFKHSITQESGVHVQKQKMMLSIVPIPAFYFYFWIELIYYFLVFKNIFSVAVWLCLGSTLG